MNARVHDTAPLLDVQGLEKTFTANGLWGRRRSGGRKAVTGFSLTLHAGETVGIVGESGCGKSTAARLMLRLIEADAGTIDFNGRDLRTLGSQDLRRIRRDMQLVFQDPYSSLDPRMTIGGMLEESLAVHGVSRSAERRERVAQVLSSVGLRPDFASRYANEFSGGQRQRVAIARALILEPRLVIADEPVSALDVSVQAQVLNLLTDLQASRGLAMIFVAHDIAVVEQVSERIAVMFAGAIVESGLTEDVIRRPLHPYTQALLAAVLSLDPRDRKERLSVERPTDMRSDQGCPYFARCAHRRDLCRDTPPAPTDSAGGRTVACHFPLAGLSTRPS